MWLTKSRLDTAGTEQFSKLLKKSQSRDLKLTFHSGNEVPRSTIGGKNDAGLLMIKIENCT